MKIEETLARIQLLGFQPNSETKTKELKNQQEIYKLLISQKKAIEIDTLSQNPYFEKYDVAGDSRNIMRELRGSVKEDIVDKGIRESQKLLRRELESRWMPARWAENAGIDNLSAYELMRPKFNEQARTYR